MQDRESWKGRGGVFEGRKESHQMCEERVSGIPDPAAYRNLSRAVFLLGEGGD